MQTITLDVIEEKAMALLEGMETLQLIRVHKRLPNDLAAAERVSKLKGAMAPQPIDEIERQLEMRNEWD